MNFLMRKFPISNGRSLVRILALGSVGTGLFYSNYATDYRTSVSVSIPAALYDSLSLPWRTLLEQTPNPALVSSNNNFRHRNLPIFLSLSSTGSSSDVKSEASWNVPRHSCNCLGRDTIANAAARVAPAVVNISARSGRGSGTIIDADGTILTCAHCVVDSLPNGKVDLFVHVSLQDGREYKGTVVNADVLLDIAIVKITSKTPLPVANLGSSSKLRPGDWVVALGCPHSLQNSVTAGIISCVDRKSSDLGLGGIRREYLQTDCAINEGNSGGPLVNIDGELIGINIMKLKKAHGLGFAVPIDTVCSIIEQFKTNRRVVRPWLGLQMIDLNDMIAAQLKEQYAAFSNVTKGVLISMVASGSPADHAGFLPGDIVIEFDGKRIGNLKEIIDIMGDRVGKPLKAVVIRSNDETVTLTVIPKEVNPDM